MELIQPQYQQRRRDSTTSKTGRRQHRSCDQCRRGKRACDLIMLRRGASNNEGQKAVSCSNCAKTNKKCTVEWLQTMRGTQIGRQRNSDNIKPVSTQTKSSSKNQTIQSTASLQKSHEVDEITNSQFYDEICRGPSTSADVQASPQDEFSSNDICSQEEDTVDWNQIANLLDYTPADNTTSEYDGENGLDSNSAQLQVPFHTADTCTDTTSETAIKSFRPGSYTSYPESTSSQPTSYSINFSNDPFPTSLQQRLATSTTHSFLTRGLIRVYHDSMENALSCWLTERTCPYSVGSKSLPSIAAKESMSAEWGPNWTNRICARVCRLDRSPSRLNSLPLTKAQDRAASNALHTAIMSFATQWAQSSQRSRSEFPSFMTSTTASGSPGTLSEEEYSYSTFRSPYANNTNPFSQVEFDRSIQEMTWHQAKKALQDSAEIESFRVIFAHIIFSLTQRPLDIDHQIQNMKTRRRRRSSSQSTFPADLHDDTSELDNIFQAEGPPISLETALRQLHSYRCKLERIERERAAKLKKMKSQSTLLERSDPLDADDRETFNLLYWLGIMFDTLSAAMHQRPLVVSDVDSALIQKKRLEDRSLITAVSKATYHDETHTISDNVPCEREDSDIWGKFFLNGTHTKQIQSTARWPCSYEEAAAVLCDAAPVKVLLFRRVTFLQSLLTRRSGIKSLEEAIHEALKVYQHWNKVYGQFILDCTSHHDNLPPRIQSWYVILAGHWHLGALLLADLIKIIDDGRLGSDTQRDLRLPSDLVNKLRRKDTYALAELARCSSPREDASFPDGPDFHFAVNKGALLTEPWTVVLIRAFGKAGTLLLQSMPSRNNNNFEEVHTACGHCLRALWHLGKKSDMAFLAATALSDALKDKTNSLYTDCSFPGRESNTEMAGFVWDNTEDGGWMMPEPFDLDPVFMDPGQPYPGVVNQGDTVLWMD